MKKTILFSAAALMVVAACSKQEASQPESKVISLKASVEQQADPDATKTSLGAGNTVLWTTGDAIKVYDDSATPKSVNLTADAGGATSAHFIQDGEIPVGYGAAKYAIYPADAATGATSAGEITFTLPATQTYVADSFDPDCNVMVGEVNAGNVSFKNTCGVLKLQLTGILKVGKIVLTSKNLSDYLYGTFTADATSATPAATRTSGGGNSITLDCSANGGVQLDRTTATNFYFVVPNGCLASGFEAEVFDIYDSYAYSTTLETSNATVVNRARIRVMPEKKVSLLPAGYTEQFCLSSNDGRYINTGVADSYATPLAGYEFFYAYTFTRDGSGNSLYLWGNRSSTIDQRTGFMTPETGRNTGFFYNHNSISRTYKFTTSKGTYHHVSFRVSTGELTHDGTTITTESKLSGEDNTTNVCIFAVGADAIHCEYPGRHLQYFRMLSGANTLARYYIPCTNSSSVAGMYDMVAGAFEPGTTPVGDEDKVFLYESWD